MQTPSDVWWNHSKQWKRVGPPLRPSGQDHEFMNRVIRGWTSRHGSPRALVLGVTPEMARLDWPEGTELLAVDRSQYMIDQVWPGFPEPGEGVLCANWMAMPLEDASRDLAVSDGPFGVLRYPHEYRKSLRALHRILQPDGLFVFRNFIRPETPEQPTTVYDAAMAGDIGNFHALKLRLLMAMQPDIEAGVCTGDVWTCWETDGPGAERLAARREWSPEQIATIEAYRGQDTVYCFPTLHELRDLLTDEGFEEIDCLWSTYELGERCPTLIFKRR